MQTTESTPGPWVAATHFAERRGGRTYIPIVRPGNDPVPLAVVHRDVDGYGKAEGEANARLVAAAPTHLSALREIADGTAHAREIARRTLESTGHA